MPMPHTAAMTFEVCPPDPPNDGMLFVDHSKTGRSGHLGHALVEYAPGKILAFHPNNLLVHDPGAKRERLLIQASHAYEKSKTNIRHWWLS